MRSPMQSSGTRAELAAEALQRIAGKLDMKSSDEARNDAASTVTT